MTEIIEISPEEFENYTRKLIPSLMRFPPGQWIQINTIAKDVARFIDVCQYLYNRGYFEDDDGFLILEIKDDAFVRLDPMYIRRHSKSFQIWK